MMLRLLFLGLFGVVCISSQSPWRFETLMENVVVLRVRSIDRHVRTVPISCGEAYQGLPVIWKKNGFLQPDLEGNHIDVAVQEWSGGNYTCHTEPEGPPRNYTLLMVQLEPDNETVILRPGHDNGPTAGYIHCSAPNYSGHFHCNWNRNKDYPDAAVLLVKGRRNHETVSCLVEPNGSRMLCLDSNCPYKEEQHRISLTVYMHVYSRLEAYTKEFYIRDIVTPKRPPDLHISHQQIHSNLKVRVFKWNYPESWEKPCTFFRLLFQVKVVHNGDTCDSDRNILTNTTTETQYEINLAKRKFVFCVRGQDKYTEGPWGDWNSFRVDHS